MSNNNSKLNKMSINTIMEKAKSIGLNMSITDFKIIKEITEDNSYFNYSAIGDSDMSLYGLNRDLLRRSINTYLRVREAIEAIDNGIVFDKPEQYIRNTNNYLKEVRRTIREIIEITEDNNLKPNEGLKEIMEILSQRQELKHEIRMERG